MFERRKAQLPRKQVVRSAGKRIGPRKKPVWDVRPISYHGFYIDIQATYTCIET